MRSQSVLVLLQRQSKKHSCFRVKQRRWHGARRPSRAEPSQPELSPFGPVMCFSSQTLALTLAIVASTEGSEAVIVQEVKSSTNLQKHKVWTSKILVWSSVHFQIRKIINDIINVIKMTLRSCMNLPHCLHTSVPPAGQERYCSPAVFRMSAVCFHDNWWRPESDRYSMSETQIPACGRKDDSDVCFSHKQTSLARMKLLFTALSAGQTEQLQQFLNMFNMWSMSWYQLIKGQWWGIGRAPVSSLSGLKVTDRRL